MQDQSERLWFAWVALWQCVGARGDARKVYNDLAARYSEPHRAYHTLEHIEHCLNEFEQAWHLAKDPNAVEFALWYHDAVYDTKVRNNEERSAVLAKEVCLKIGLSSRFASRVQALILSSKHHRCNPENPDERILTDIDLAAWGKSWEGFQKDTDEIRREYSWWVPEDVFRKKRAEILQEFLDRPRIYNTAYFYGRYEAQAQRNLVRSIAELSKHS